MRRHRPVTVADIVSDAGQPDRIKPGRNTDQHDIGVRHVHQIRQHPAVLDAGKRLHPVVGQHRVLGAVGRPAAGAGSAPAAAQLERREHELSDGNTGNARPHRYDLGDRLMTDREPVWRGWPGIDQRRVDLAARHSQRPDERVIAAAAELGCRDVPPLQSARSRAGQLLHAGSPPEAGRSPSSTASIASVPAAIDWTAADVPSQPARSCPARPWASATRTCAMSDSAPAQQTGRGAAPHRGHDELPSCRARTRRLARVEIGERPGEHDLGECGMLVANKIPQRDWMTATRSARGSCGGLGTSSRRLPSAGSPRRTPRGPARPCHRTARRPPGSRSCRRATSCGW